MRILLVDDDPEIRLGFTAALKRRGHQVVTAASVESALSLAGTVAPDVGVIDVMLPDGDGFSLCRAIRTRWGFPTVMLTARDEDVDVVGGLEAGADDYIVKPVSAPVLEARLRAVLRRSSTTERTAREPVVTISDLEIDEAAAEARVKGTALTLSATEFRLLAELARNHGQALSREHLIDEVWRENPPNTPRVVDTAMQRLRARLAEADLHEPSLETLRGFGYRLR
ncbi:DNA-binding response regulator [Curtobacterium sp. MCPF17_018]|uniref:response regulator transcription factor n=1 Tax=Curtobacterium sp. MCPF17_018 TaxID=2175638 RepID=UPI000DA902AF|nr:response regulator transcription factor [Curtobacterium sp. MCPF17_018]PZE69288.1 DNA-binding response regulator [Curtobacterium sp. MCPF17_018]